MYCFCILQDCAVLHVDMENFKLIVPGESCPRTLQCRILEPDQADESNPMTHQQLMDIFYNGEQNSAVDEELEDQAQIADADCEGVEDDGMMEAENLLHDLPMHQGDGGLVDNDEFAAEDKMEDYEANDTLVADTLPDDVPMIPMIPLGVAVGEDPTLHGDFSDGELMEFQAEPKSHLQALPDDDIVQPSASASSSSGLTNGLNITPWQARARLPIGARIQHRRAKDVSRASGWQGWPSNGLPSRFFSYGGMNGRFKDSPAAFEDAISWLWSTAWIQDSAVWPCLTLWPKMTKEYLQYRFAFTK